LKAFILPLQNYPFVSSLVNIYLPNPANLPSPSLEFLTHSLSESPPPPHSKNRKIIAYSLQSLSRQLWRNAPPPRFTGIAHHALPRPAFPCRQIRFCGYTSLLKAFIFHNGSSGYADGVSLEIFGHAFRPLLLVDFARAFFRPR
jgi:hypothetical protein